MNKNVWLFIDIDGCIMDSMFNNAFYDTDQQKISSIISAYEKGRSIKLYPEFIEWYKRITHNEDFEIEAITFITGRQENCFGWLTYIQMLPLEKIHWFGINYFYQYGKHTWEAYRQFKTHSILDSLSFSNFTGQIKIYDDFDFLEDLEEILDRRFEFHLIKDKEDWNRL